MNYEVLSQDRQRCRSAHFEQIVNRSAEEMFLREHGDGAGPGILIKRSGFSRVQVFANISFRWRSALVFGDDFDLGIFRSERFVQPMRFGLFSDTKRIVTNGMLRSNAKKFGKVFSLSARNLDEQINH